MILVLAVSAAAFVSNMLVDVSEIFSLTLILFGLWIIVLAGIRTASPEQYGGGAFNTFSGGILLTTLGVVWFLYDALVEAQKVKAPVIASSPKNCLGLENRTGSPPKEVISDLMKGKVHCSI